MLESLTILNDEFNNFLEQGDPRVKEWPLMQNPFPGMVMVAAYIYFVKVAGPQWMHKRQAYELRLLMVVYNFLMVFVNFTIFCLIGWFGWFNGYSLMCQPVDYSDAYDAVMMAKIGWWFYVIKFVEFADTVFFVLRKKNSQISALHVIHHSIVPFSLWFGIKFAPGGYNAFFPFLNSLVHVIMYSYYGLSALGPKFQKFLFWKKYMTYMQISQFVAVVIYALVLLFGGCQISKTFIAMNIVHALLFLVLFINFFVKSYGARRTRSTVGHTQLNGKKAHNGKSKESSKDSNPGPVKPHFPMNGVKEAYANQRLGTGTAYRVSRTSTEPENNIFNNNIAVPLAIATRHFKYS